jgi:hypothetical protein
MRAVKNLCKNGILLRNGLLDYIGTAEDCVDRYLDTNIDDIVSHIVLTKENRTKDECDVVHDIEMLEATLLNSHPEAMATDEDIMVELLIKRNSSRRKECQYSIVITDTTDTKVLNIVSEMIPIPFDRDTYKVRLTADHHGLPGGRYKIHIAIGRKDFSGALINYDVAFDLLSFEIKYITATEKKEYFRYERSWGIILHNKENIKAEIM